MSDQPLVPIDQQPKQVSEEWTRSAYEMALETAHHSDTLIYEVAAIVWSANALLLGFVLEVPLEAERQSLVFWTAIVGIFFSAYVPFVQWLAKKGQRKAFELCREIERKELPHWLQLHNQIHAIYPKLRGQVAIWTVSTLFTLLWLCVLRQAWISLHN